MIVGFHVYCKGISGYRAHHISIGSTEYLGYLGHLYADLILLSTWSIIDGERNENLPTTSHFLKPISPWGCYNYCFLTLASNVSCCIDIHNDYVFNVSCTLWPYKQCLSLCHLMPCALNLTLSNTYIMHYTLCFFVCIFLFYLCPSFYFQLFWITVFFCVSFMYNLGLSFALWFIWNIFLNNKLSPLIWSRYIWS